MGSIAAARIPSPAGLRLRARLRQVAVVCVASRSCNYSRLKSSSARGWTAGYFGRPHQQYSLDYAPAHLKASCVLLTNFPNTRQNAAHSGARGFSRFQRFRQCQFRCSARGRSRPFESHPAVTAGTQEPYQRFGRYRTAEVGIGASAFKTRLLTSVFETETALFGVQVR